MECVFNLEYPAHGHILVNIDFSFAFFVVFEAKITSRNIGELNIEYGFDVQAIYKVRNIIGIINL